MFTLVYKNLFINSQRREEIKEKMDNTNKIVKPNLRKKGTVTNEKTLANEKVSWTDENINRVENLSILEQAKQQNEIDSQQMKELKEQKKKKTKQIVIIGSIVIAVVLAILFIVVAITKNKTTDKNPKQDLVEAGTVGVNPVTGDPISREQASEYQEKLKDTNRSEAELFYNSSDSISINKEQYVRLYSYYRNNGYNTSNTNELVDKYFKDNKEYKGTDEENKKADNLASDNNIKSDWGNTTGTINSKDTSTSHGADINGSTKTFKPSDELRKYNEEASKANEKAE